MPLAEAKGAAIYPPTPLPRHCEARSTVAACSSSSEADGFSTAGLWHARSSALTSAEQASRSDLVRVRVRVRVNPNPNPSPSPNPSPNPNPNPSPNQVRREELRAQRGRGGAAQHAQQLLHREQPHWLG